MPKSVSRTRPSGVSRMLPGLTSRWTKPARWAASSAPATPADVDGELRAEALLPVEQLAQTLAVDELHHYGLAAVVLEHVVDGDDVRVIQPGDGDRFAPEPFGDHGIGGEVRLQPLDGDPAVELDVGGDPHLGHPTVTDPPFEVVPLREQLDGRVGDGRRGRRGRGRRGHDRQFTLVVPTAGFWAFAQKMARRVDR